MIENPLVDNCMKLNRLKLKTQSDNFITYWSEYTKNRGGGRGFFFPKNLLQAFQLCKFLSLQNTDTA